MWRENRSDGRGANIFRERVGDRVLSGVAIHNSYFQLIDTSSMASGRARVLIILIIVWRPSEKQ